MLIRKNTKPFKTILEIVNACHDRPDRGQLIRIYITKAGDSVRDRISIEGIQEGAALFYEMGYQAVLGNLKSASHQLHQSDEIPGVYFFRSGSNKVWDETPFEFDEVIKKEFGTLPELPVLRKKGKAEKFILPDPKMKAESKPTKKEKTPANKKMAAPKKADKVVVTRPKQPDYHLRHEINFTGLERIIFSQPQVLKKDVLDYYNKIAEYLLPYLKGRPQVIRLHRNGQPGVAITNLEALVQITEEIPEWIRTTAVTKGKGSEQLLLCNDREHLLFYAQLGCVEFKACHSRLPGGASAKAGTKSLDSPDYIILAIESPGYEFSKVVDVAHAVNEILKGLQLPSFVKTDGVSGLQIYIPMDSKSDFESGKQAAGYLCKLARLKIPELVTLKGSEDNAYGKVSIDYLVNEQGKGVVAPYSLVAGPSPNVATPLLWEEITDGITMDSFNYETIFKRLQKTGDPFEGLFRKKVNADALLERMKVHYSFLL